jgi:hypothetical protein
MFMKIMILFVSFLLISCSTVKSNMVDGQNIQEGISYFLPKRLHKVKITANLITADVESERKAKEAFEKAAEAKRKAKEECDTAESEYKKAEEIAEIAVGEEAKKEADKQKGIALANLQVKKIALGEACKKETETYEKLKKVLESTQDASQNKCNYLVKFSVEPQTLVPDHNYGFVAKLKHIPSRTDTLKLTTTDMGLLSSGESVSADTTGSILAKLAQAIISFGVQIPLPSVPPVALRVKKIEEKRCPESLEIDSIVDLSNSADIKQLNARLQEINMRLQVCGYHTDQKCDKLEDSCELKVTGPSKVEHYGNDGLFYRRELPYLVKLLEFKETKKCDQGSEQIVKESTVRADALVLMPNLSPITRLDYPAGLFATSKQKVDFNNGMLVSYNAERPSEILGLVSIPADIAQSMISALTQFFRFRIDYSSSQIELAKKQSELIDVLNETVKKMNKGQAPKSD